MRRKKIDTGRSPDPATDSAVLCVPPEVRDAYAAWKAAKEEAVIAMDALLQLFDDDLAPSAEELAEAARRIYTSGEMRRLLLRQFEQKSALYVLSLIFKEK